MKLTRKTPLVHESATCWMVLFSTMDYFMTYTLLYFGAATGQPIVEVNPVAALFLEVFGEHGLLAFKTVMTLFICWVIQMIGVRSPRKAMVTLRICVGLLVAVTVYQMALLLVASGAVDCPPVLRNLITVQL